MGPSLTWGATMSSVTTGRRGPATSLALCLAAAVLALVSAGGAAPAVGTTSEPASLGGRVVSDVDGRPLAGMEVELVAVFDNGLNTEFDSTLTDAAGRYRFDDVRRGHYKVEVVGEGEHAGEWWRDAPDLLTATRIPVADGAQVTDVDHSLAPTGSVSGRVISDRTGAPLAGLGVAVRSTRVGGSVPRPATVTDDQGRFRVTGVPPGTNHLVVHGDGEHLGEWWDDTDESGRTPLQVAAGAEVEGLQIGLVPAASISGTVRDDDGAIVTDATITTHDSRGFGRSASTDAAGRFTIDGLAADSYHVSLHRRGFTASEWWRDSPDRAGATPVVLGVGSQVAIEPRLAVAPAPEPWGHLEGRVTDTSGRPLESVRVSTYPFASGSIGLTSQTGAFRLSLPPGEYRVEFSHPDHLDEHWENAHDAAEATWITVHSGQTVSGIDAALDAESSVAGRVVDRAGRPVAGAYVRVNLAGPGRAGLGGEAVTDEAGSYVVEGTGWGPHTLAVSPSLQHTFTGTFLGDTVVRSQAQLLTLSPGDRATPRDVTVVPGATIRGAVTDLEGRGLVRRPVVVTALDELSLLHGGSYELRTDDRGEWSTPSRLPIGRYRVSFYCDDFFFLAERGKLALSTVVVVGEGAVVERDLALRMTPEDPAARNHSCVIETAAPPRVTGPLRVGRTVMARVGRTSPAGVRLTYRWLAGQRRVGGTGPQLRLRPGQRGSRIRVVVTATRPGSAPVRFRSAATRPVR